MRLYVAMQTRSWAGEQISCGSSDELMLQAWPSWERMVEFEHAVNRPTAPSAPMTKRNMSGSIEATFYPDKLNSRASADRLRYEVEAETDRHDYYEVLGV